MWNAHQAGAPFDSVLTIGRQNLCLHPGEADVFLSSPSRLAGAELTAESLAFGVFAEPFLRACFGARRVEAIDYSEYDGAQHIHDMNEPVPQSLVGGFDVVFDGGALEHVFNFPVAISNLMRMTRVGGRIFMSTPANNFCGHGFYQFSPELMYRVFGPENGFEIRTVQLVEARYPSPELTRNRVAYTVADPAVVRSRVGLVNKRPVLMLVEAVKLREVTLFARAPLQSDYVSIWSTGSTTGPPRDSGAHGSRGLAWRTRALRFLPKALRTRLRGWVEVRRYSLANRRFYRRVP